VSALSGARQQLGSALVTQEVVARQDVVDLEALGAGKALAHVALEQCRVPHQLGPFLVRELARFGRPPTRLAAGGRFHAP
jgi:hypothetical protein